jgi:acyl carrier protein
MAPSTSDRIRAIVARLAGISPDFDATADLFRDIGLKSVVALDLLLSVEEEFGVSISDEAFGQARTLTSLTSLVEGLG